MRAPRGPKGQSTKRTRLRPTHERSKRSATPREWAGERRRERPPTPGPARGRAGASFSRPW
eukprot:5634132-Alexandrium_andersonii.AAC.1